MTKLVPHEPEMKRLMEGLAYGMLNLGFAIQADYQQSMKQGTGPLPRPRSLPGEPPAVQTGNLRRSAHVVAFMEGKPVASQGPVPDYGSELEGGIGVIVGTNTGYGLFLEVGTGKMAARPALVPAAIRQQQKADRLIEAGARAHYKAVK